MSVVNLGDKSRIFLLSPSLFYPPPPCIAHVGSLAENVSLYTYLSYVSVSFYTAVYYTLVKVSVIRISFLCVCL